MKITKDKLRDLIKEELDSLKELDGPDVSTSDLRKKTMARARMGTSGISKSERSMLDTVEDALRQAAAQGNITIGRTRRLVELLLQQLEKMGVTVSAPEASEPEAPEPGPAAGGGGAPSTGGGGGPSIAPK
jgi:hypothetical protein